MTKTLHKHVCEEHIFAKIHQKYAINLHDFIYYKYGNQVDANDKVQHAFLKLWENCKDIMPEKAKSFLFSVANNASLNVMKHKKVVLNYQKQPQKNSYAYQSRTCVRRKGILRKV